MGVANILPETEFTIDTESGLMTMVVPLRTKEMIDGSSLLDTPCDATLGARIYPIHNHRPSFFQLFDILPTLWTCYGLCGRKGFVRILDGR